MLPLALLPPHAYNQGALSGGRVRFGRWVPQDVKCGRSGSRTVTAAGAAAATLPWDAGGVRYRGGRGRDLPYLAGGARERDRPDSLE